MSVFKLYNGKRITPQHPKYKTARWWVYKRLGKGRVIHQSIPEASSKAEAETAERELVRRAFNKKYGQSDNTDFTTFATGPYQRYCEQNNVNVGAKKLYIRTLCAYFKKTPVVDISPQRCRDCQAYLRKRASSPSSVNRVMSTLSKIFTLAGQEGILDKNPMQHVAKLKEPPPRKRRLTHAQRERLWNELQADPLMLRLVQLAVNLPLRRGQLLAISPASVDLSNGLLSVIASKGRESRTIPINATATLVLSRMIKDGQVPFPLKDFRKRWGPMLIRAGINKEGGTREENFHFHDLRTEFGSEMIRKNVNPKVVQQLYAHSTAAITDVYIAEDFDEMAEAVKRLDEDVQNSEVIQ
jgi:integrase/recombinase XerC